MGGARFSGGGAGRAGRTPAAEDAAGRASAIVVTARRREESLQETPIAISVFSAEALAERQIHQTQDLERITPSLQFKPAGQLSGNSSASVAFIRGIGQLDPTAAVDPGVGRLHRRGLRRARGRQHARVRRHRQRRGPARPARNAVRRAPRSVAPSWCARASPSSTSSRAACAVRGGSDELLEGFAAFNLPITATAAARVLGGFRKRDGYVIRAFDGLDLGNENVGHPQRARSAGSRAARPRTLAAGPTTPTATRTARRSRSPGSTRTRRLRRSSASPRAAPGRRSRSRRSRPATRGSARRWCR